MNYYAIFTIGFLLLLCWGIYNENKNARNRHSLMEQFLALDKEAVATAQQKNIYLKEITAHLQELSRCPNKNQAARTLPRMRTDQ